MSRPRGEPSDSCKLALADDLLHSGHTVQSRCCGSSMIPVLWPGDLLTIKPLSPEELAIGDVVVVARGDCFATHRLIWAGDLDGTNYWITRGDSLQLTDSPTTAERIVGRVSRIERGGKVMVPEQKPNRVQRSISVLIARSDFFRWMALRLYRVYQTYRTRDQGVSESESLSVASGRF